MKSRSAALGVMAATVALSGPARADHDSWVGTDKALHFGVSAALAAGGYGAASLVTPDRRLRILFGTALSLAAGVGKEVSDRYTGGDPSHRDLAWDVLGTATGVFTAWLFDRLRA